ncbi:hypothetical protein L1987_69205 [Smallanthus sonchifolius]|uniref:Uncharacterized protein n=1 Tax=Smallanthus sonchifolius TaxID=185202 RepID=A0ACB9B531_9ASTR|nr:hypothetical protein L1987_69205 [Smallanthus sonchifolius]
MKMDVSEHGMLLRDVILDKGAPESDSTVDTKLRWLRSQMTFRLHSEQESLLMQIIQPQGAVFVTLKTTPSRLFFPFMQSLAQVIEIGLDEQGMIDMDDLKLRLEFYQSTGRPMLGSFSACSTVSGICSHTRSLACLLHKYGAFACFDFAASPHKFLGGPGSPGILLMSMTLYKLKDAPPSTCGGGTVDYVNHFNEQLLNDLFGIQARGGCACAGPYGHFFIGIDEPHSLAIRSAVKMGYNGAKIGWTRVSFPYYMSDEEYEFILAAIEFVAVYGQRFLPPTT